MRIAFNGQIFSMQKFGGVSRYISALTLHLVNNSQNARIFAPLHQNSYLQTLPPKLVYGRHLAYCPNKASGIFATINHTVASYKIKSWQPNVIHDSYYSALRTGREGTPTVLTVHDMIHELYFSNSRATKIKRIAIERADHLICISQNTKNDLLELLSIPEDKISTIHHGFDSSFSQLEALTDPELHLDRPFLLYVGSREKYKNFDSLLLAISNSIKLRQDFNLIAFGGGAWTSAERKKISDMGFNKNQIHQVTGGDDLLATLYKSATALVYPSSYEGFGLPPLEAMACACPVISSNASSMPEVIGNAGEFFDPAETDDITDSIERVVYSDQVRESLVGRGHERLKSFSWDKCAKETLSVYRALTA